MDEKPVVCKECGYQMYYVENERKNNSFTVKVDTWRCCNCQRTVEEMRKHPGWDYK